MTCFDTIILIWVKKTYTAFHICPMITQDQYWFYPIVLYNHIIYQQVFGFINNVQYILRI